MITVVTGSMFSGKTNRFISLINSAKVTGARVAVFKPDTDSRSDDIISRDGSSLKAEKILATATTRRLIELFENYDIIGIDEAQFFSQNLVEAIKILNRQPRQIEFIISGLAKDFKCDPFGPMPYLLAMADVIIQEFAVCNTCKSRQATRTHRIAGGNAKILVGSSDLYEAACPDCYTRLVYGKD